MNRWDPEKVAREMKAAGYVWRRGQWVQKRGADGNVVPIRPGRLAQIKARIRRQR
jgi:hypothetical protein